MLKIIISCEHGGNTIPTAYQQLFKSHTKLLKSHQGWDIGALALAKSISKAIPCHFFYTEISRLLVELNRSTHHTSLFSSITKVLDKGAKANILANFYYTYRNPIEKLIQQLLNKANTVIHISVHTFTPELLGHVRNNAIGLLYDPARQAEKILCTQWKHYLISLTQHYKIRFNYPYAGKTDGFVNYLRKQFTTNYIGIELEVNQKFFSNTHAQNNEIEEIIIQSLNLLIKSYL